MERERYSLVDVFDNNIWTASCPVDIRQGALIYDALVGQHCLQLQMVNQGEKPLVSVYVDVYCYDESGNLLLGEPINIIYRDLNMPKDGVFGDTETFYLRSGRVASVSCHVVQVMFRSGEMWRPAGRPIRVTAQRFDQLDADLQRIFFRRLKDSYFASVDTEFKMIARQDREFWVCTCGKANDNNQEQCQRCGMNRNWILQNLNVETLTALRDAQDEQEQEEASGEPSTDSRTETGDPAVGEGPRTVRMDDPARETASGPSGDMTSRYVPVREQAQQEQTRAQQQYANYPRYDRLKLEEDEEDDEPEEGVSLAIKIALSVASVLLLVTVAGILWYFLR